MEIIRFISSLTTFLLVITPQVDAIKCYKCTSFPGSGCGDEDFRLNYLTIQDCDYMDNGERYLNPYDAPRMCKKEIQKTSDGIVIMRGCLTKKEFEEVDYSQDICVQQPYNQNVICRCERDYCNDAISHRYINLSVLPLLSFGLTLLIANQYH